jgi:hypothetical protein
MEKITNSMFPKFEGTQISNLKAIMGGAETGAGSKCITSGSHAGECMEWTSDTTTAASPGYAATISYSGVAYSKRPCEA